MSQSSGQDWMRARQAMILGLGRQAMTAPAALAPHFAAAPDVDSARAVMALAAQRQRFQRPPAGLAADVPSAARQMHADERPIVPPHLRRALWRLSNAVAKSQSQAILFMQSAVTRITFAGYRPHPFDLPWLMPYLHEVACLGLAERAYLALTQKPEAGERGGVLHAMITIENWTEFPKAHRRDFIAQQRAADPAGARALLESVFKSEPAPVRGDLLGALSVKLSADDLPFLESLAGDRAESVKTVAARLIACIPGSTAHAARLAEAAACFQKKSGAASLMSRIGLGTTGDVTFVAPKDDKGKPIVPVALFDGLSLGDLVAATGLSAEKLLASIADEPGVLGALASTAVAGSDEVTRALLFEQKVKWMCAGPPLRAHTLSRLMPVARGPMTLDLANIVLSSAAWTGLIAELSDPNSNTRDDGAIVLVALLMPAGALPRLLAAIEPFSMNSAREARAFADFVLAIPTQS
ncbi:MAG: hypothetical protein HC841_04280 [Verrucomicrobiae bacterium]|nr:hypothetical protein [Verrucomicrobiae bacterium]